MQVALAPTQSRDQEKPWLLHPTAFVLAHIAKPNHWFLSVEFAMIRLWDEKGHSASSALSAVVKAGHFPIHLFPRDSVLFLDEVDKFQNVEIWVWNMDGGEPAEGIDLKVGVLGAEDFWLGSKRE